VGESRKKKTKVEKAADKLSSRKGKGKADRTDPAALIAAARAAAFTDQSPERAFKHFRPLAEQVPTADLPVFTGQPLLMRVNILAALDAVEPHLAAAVSALREPRLEEIFELPALVMGLDFAAGRVPVVKLSAGEIEKSQNPSLWASGTRPHPRHDRREH
jgi:hypothetical protein